ncbi:polysaccharide deacetylase family protein [Neorhizobium sp. JUb45]|uniref:polysaccharide deacetylase family protein n=1 Tax=unclassified Neorhizobium TaxID=2629175 RepID=UPI001050ED21|nr:polysaccharide deacetylase family protein [Neorhizobium sp. JUb45]TCR06764.1 polysaccharide deacetylase [Neorhizobium sp. JUb45]
MSRVSSLLALTLFAAIPATLAAPAAMAAEKPKQLVLISFDGAGSNDLWQRSRDIAKRTNARFTYFLSCTLVIDRASAKTYQGPGQKPGRSNIGFAQTKEEARIRLGHVWQAKEEGNEIASHTCGHFDGGEWTSQEWTQELKTFRNVLSNAWVANDAAEQEPAGWQDFVKTGIRGFRAPYLSQGPALMQAERQAGFVYDASPVTRGPEVPEEKDGVFRFGLPTIPEGPQQRPIIAMDYNLFIRHSAGIENPSRSAEFEERAYSAFKAAFDKQYDGKRIPLQIGFHFVEMNAGAYWRAMERLVTDVCGMQDVACVTHSQAMAMLSGNETTASAGLRQALPVSAPSSGL